MSLAAGRRDPRLKPVAGFETTAYAWAGRRLVWAGSQACTDHPRNWLQPWQPPRPAEKAADSAALGQGARQALALLWQWPARGLLPWLAGQPLPFPLQLAQPRLDALRQALQANDVQAFCVAAPRLLGLGPGLTPSGDDLLGGLFFALVHAPRRGWSAPLRRLQADLRRAARGGATNPISAALLGDLMRGTGYRALHEMLPALRSGRPAAIDQAARALLELGASSGADLLCGLLLGLSSAPTTQPTARTTA